MLWVRQCFNLRGTFFFYSITGDAGSRGGGRGRRIPAASPPKIDFKTVDPSTHNPKEPQDLVILKENYKYEFQTTVIGVQGLRVSCQIKLKITTSQKNKEQLVVETKIWVSHVHQT